MMNMNLFNIFNEKKIPGDDHVVRVHVVSVLLDVGGVGKAVHPSKERNRWIAKNQRVKPVVPCGHELVVATNHGLLERAVRNVDPHGAETTETSESFHKESRSHPQEAKQKRRFSANIRENGTKSPHNHRSISDSTKSQCNF